MNPTVRAIATAIRACYVLCTFILLVTFLFPFLGWHAQLANALGADQLIRFGVGWALVGVLMEHARGTVLRGRQAWLAQALLRVSPEMKRLEAVRILIPALVSEDEKVANTAHQELKRLTEQDLGHDPAAWLRWLKSHEKGKSAST